MPSLDLQEKYVLFIKKTITDILPDIKIFIFGSRVQEKAREYSDVDIALESTDEIPFESILRIKSLFQESTFPYKVDIIDLKTIDEKFFDIIKNDLYKIN